MKINWRLRLQNRATLAALIASTVSFAYIVLGLLDIVPGVTESQVTDFSAMVLNALTLLGIIIDPTTDGFSDSRRAMDYKNPALNVNEAKD